MSESNFTSQLAEAAIVGAILQDEVLLPRIKALVKPEHFSIATYAEIYKFLIKLGKENKVIDIVSVSEQTPHDQLVRWGGHEVLIRCVDQVVSFENVVEYSSFVIDKFKARQLSIALQKAKAKLAAGDMAAAIATLQEDLIALKAVDQSVGFQSIGKLMIDWFADLEAMIAEPSLAEDLFLQTGFIDFDKTVGGLSVGINILAARPAMGKTAYALTEAYQVAARGKTVLFFSLEMSQKQLVRRFAAMASGIDSTRLDRGQLNHEANELEWVATTLEDAQRLGLHFINNVTEVSELIGKVEEWRLINGRSPDLVVIDYLGLLKARGISPDEYSQVTYISREIREYFTTRLGIPCRLLHQLNRSVEDRNDKRPQMSDLRSSGQIEQDATQITFLYRDEVYNPNTVDVGICEVLTRKNREGSTGMIKVFWAPETTRFFNLAQNEY